MKRLFIAIGLVLPMLTSLAQGNSRHEEDSLLSVLHTSIPEPARMHALTALAEYQVLKPGEIKADFDSAENYIREAKGINSKVKSVDAEGYLLFVSSMLAKESGEREKGKEMVSKAIELLKKGINKSYFARANFELATYYNYEKIEQRTEMIRLVEIAVEAYRQTNNVERYAYSLEFLADLYLEHRDFPKCLDALDRSLAAYKSINRQNLYGVYILYGNLYLVDKNNRQALKYNLMAMKNAESMGETGMQLCQIYNTIGNMYVALKEIETALPYYDKGLRVALRHRDTSAVLLLMNNFITNVLVLKRNNEAVAVMNSIPAGYYTSSTSDSYVYVLIANFNLNLNLGHYEKARKYANELIDFSEKHKIRKHFMYNFYKLMVFYLFATKQHSKIDYYLSRMDSVSNFNTASGVMNQYMLRFRRDTAFHRYQSAVANLLTYVKLSDSVFSETNNRERKQMEVEYETIKKEDSIRLKNKDILLLTQKNKLQQANLTQDRLQKNIAMGGGVVLAIILLLVYMQYRQKQKNNILVTKKNEQLQHYLAEKEWLVREIHHRVKNNLQIVMSLLNSQSAYIDNEPARNAIHDSQHRVHAMSLIHQKLYGSENFSSVSLPVYIREMGTYLAESFDLGQRIHLVYDIAPLEMDVSQAVPLGLILNEAITNAIKYAFPDRKGGTISISLLNIGADEYLLSVSDNGIGIPPGYMATKGSLGMSLMQGLTESLNGSFSIENNNGTTIKIAFMTEHKISQDAALATSKFLSN